MFLTFFFIVKIVTLRMENAAGETMVTVHWNSLVARDLLTPEKVGQKHRLNNIPFLHLQKHNFRAHEKMFSAKIIVLIGDSIFTTVYTILLRITMVILPLPVSFICYMVSYITKGSWAQQKTITKSNAQLLQNISRLILAHRSSSVTFMYTESIFKGFTLLF